MRWFALAGAGCVGATVTDDKSATAPPSDTGCDAAEAPIGWDDPTDLGTPRALAEAVAFGEDTTFGYADGRTTGLRLAVTLDTDAAPTGLTLLGGDPDCDVPRELRLPLRLAFETADGAFLEDTALTAVARDGSTQIVNQPAIPAAAHLGSFDVTGWDVVNLAVVRWSPPTAGEVVLIRGTAAECGVGAWGMTVATACP